MDTDFCEGFKLAKLLVKALLPAVHQGNFDPAGDRCFCESCHAARGDQAAYTRGSRPYLIPVGWHRIGLGVIKEVVEEHKVFDSWQNSLHGSNLFGAKKIMSNKLTLLGAGDVALGGVELGVVDGHIPKPFERTNKYTCKKEMFNPNQIFSSPSIPYSGNPVYSKAFTPTEARGVPDKDRLKIQLAFQLRQRPGSYDIGQETIRADDRRIDPLISNDELEYYTIERSGHVIHSLLVKISR